jgi:aquaporin Z
MIKLFVEYLGTFLFLSVILAVAGKSAVAPLLIGLALTTAVAFGGDISGGHFNPAVSTMFWLGGSLTAIELFGYILAQVLGGASAHVFSVLTKA